MAHQDDYFYEIQLTNKQLVFYFMAVASALVLSFLLGVMVGRGVDQGAGEVVQAARPVQEDRIVTEEPPRPAPPAAEDLSYAKRLDGEKAEEGLEKPPAATLTPVAPPRTVPVAPARPRPTPVAKPSPRPSAVASTPKPAPPAVVATPRAAPATGGAFAIQVGAFKDRASADAIVTRLKGKGFAAYVVSPEGEGLFNVRVGSFAERAEAEKVQARLRDDEKFKPFIVVKN